MKLKLSHEELGELLGSLLAAFCAEGEECVSAKDFNAEVDKWRADLDGALRRKAEDLDAAMAARESPPEPSVAVPGAEERRPPDLVIKGDRAVAWVPAATRRAELLKLVGSLAPIPDGAGVNEVVGLALGYLRAVDGALKSEGMVGELKALGREIEEATQKALRDSLHAQQKTIDHLRAERDRLQSEILAAGTSRIAREAEG